jgi:hypothetical protein
MTIITAIVFAAGAGFAFAVVITIIVIVGIRREERYLTLANRNAPGVMAQLARIMLGRYVRKELNGDDRDIGNHDHSRERGVGPRS